MTIRSGPGPHHALTHSRLVVTAGRSNSGWLPWALLAAVALWLGSHELRGGDAFRDMQAVAGAVVAGASVQPPAQAAASTAALQQRIEQGELTLKVADARSQELERQIDGLNQRLREAQDELAFFRKARGSRH